MTDLSDYGRPPSSLALPVSQFKMACWPCGDRATPCPCSDMRRHSSTHERTWEQPVESDGMTKFDYERNGHFEYGYNRRFGRVIGSAPVHRSVSIKPFRLVRVDGGQVVARYMTRVQAEEALARMRRRNPDTAYAILS